MRKWLVRSLVFVVAGSMGALGYCYQCFTNPAAVREQVVAKLQVHFPGAAIMLDSARMSLLGGIIVTDLRLTRREDPDRSEILHVPCARFHHDKEKLLDGSMSLRKIVLDRPRLRLVRNPDGQWNLDGFCVPSPPDVPAPTLVIRHGTLTVDDRTKTGELSTFEITDVNLTVINDPLPTLCFEGSARCSLADTVHLHGTVDRKTKVIALHVKARDVPLNKPLLDRLACSFPCCGESQIVLKGKADIEAAIAITPPTPPSKGGENTAAPPLEGGVGGVSFDVRLHLREGSVQHPRLPYPLEEVKATLQATNGQMRIEKLQARAGKAIVELTAAANFPCPDQDFQASVIVKHLPMTEQLFDRLPEQIRKLYVTFKPSGPATLRLDCARRGGEWVQTASKFYVLPENMSLCFNKFPYPVDRVTGTVEMDLVTELVHVDATMYSGASPIFVKGTWQGQGPAADARFDIVANDVPIDEKLVQALPPHLQKVVHDFRALGRGNIKSHVRHAPGGEWSNEYHVYFTDGAVLWREFPYPLEKITGYLDIYPKHWELRELKGFNQGSQVTINGFTSQRDAKGDCLLHLEIAGRNLGLDTDLWKALQPLPGLAKAWETFHPIGRLNFAARVNHPLLAKPLPAEEQRLRDLDVAIDVQGCSIEPSFLPYVLEDLRGRFRYHSGRLDMTRVAAKHGATEITLGQGGVDFLASGAIYADFKDLRAHPLVPDADFFDALPPALQTSFAALKIKDPIEIQTRLIVAIGAEPAAAPDIYWDGQLVVRNGSLYTGIELSKLSGTLTCLGRYQNNRLRAFQGKLSLEQVRVLDQPLQWVYAQMNVKDKAPGVLNIDLRAPFFGGEVTGPIRVDFNDAKGKNRFELTLAAAQVNLQQFGQHNFGPKPELQGTMAAKLRLTGQGDDTLDGYGSLDIPPGAHILNLPLLLDLLNFLGARWPDRTAFEEAHASFAIKGSRVSVRRMDLYGNVVSLSGRGDFKIDGSDLNLDFYPSWGRMENLLPPAGRVIPAAITKNLLKIEMRGKVGGDLRFNKKPVPVITDPILQMRNRMIGAAKD